MQSINGFESAISMLSSNLKRPLEFLADNIKEDVEEIRIRSLLPLALTIKGNTYFIRKDGTLFEYITRDLITVTEKDLNDSFLLLCNNSVYAHTEEIKEGYIRLKNGNRAGVCGSFSSDGNLLNISSVNIRIAHEIIGCADELCREFDGGGMLIAGAPGSGKTTLLRDLIRQLSSGVNSKPMRISVIDSRGELSGSGTGQSLTDLGKNTDVLMINNKAIGTQMAVRTLFPDIVAFDEIGTEYELEQVSECFNAGVSIITTAHVGSLEELLERNITSKLLRSGVISKVCLLSSAQHRAFEILSTRDILQREYA